MIRIAIVEDETEQAEQLQKFIARYGAERKTETAVTVFRSGVDFISDYTARFDLVLMDIVMPLMTGMECAVRLRALDRDVALVFVTNMVQYAVKGYEVEAMGYVVKPVEYFSFKVLMDKVAARVQKLRDDVEIIVKNGDYMKRILSRELLYVEVMDHYLIYHTEGGVYRELGRMRDIESRLGPEFFRCSNCYLVNMRHVFKISDCEVTVGKETLLISRRRKKDFMNAINGYFKMGGGG